MDDSISLSKGSLPQLGGYAIQRELSAGRSYLAEGSGGRGVVLKLLEADCMQKRQLHPLVHDRMGRVRELAHLGVASLHGAWRDGGRAFLVWEYVEGRTLEEYLAGGDEAARPRLAMELVAAVESLHALGIVHGALHARNVIVTTNGSVKLTHLSPLLYTEPQVDVESLLALLAAMGCGGAPSGEGVTLRQIALRLAGRTKGRAAAADGGNRDGSGSGSGAAGTAAGPGRRVRRLALIGALAVAAAGAAASWGLWRMASRQAPAEWRSAVDGPAGPAQR